MELGLLHQTQIRITQPAAEGRNGASVGTERVAVVVLPEDAFRNEAAHAWCYIRNAAQLLHETTAKALEENDQDVRSLPVEQRVLYVVGRLRIESLEEVCAVFLRKEIIAAGIVVGQTNAAGKGIDGIDGSMVGKLRRMRLRGIDIALTHPEDSRNNQEEPDDADVPHPEAFRFARRKRLWRHQDAGDYRPQSK